MLRLCAMPQQISRPPGAPFWLAVVRKIGPSHLFRLLAALIALITLARTFPAFDTISFVDATSVPLLSYSPTVSALYSAASILFNFSQANSHQQAAWQAGPSQQPNTGLLTFSVSGQEISLSDPANYFPYQQRVPIPWFVPGSCEAGGCNVQSSQSELYISQATKFSSLRVVVFQVPSDREQLRPEWRPV